MIKFLAKVAKDARVEAEIKIARICVAADLDASTLYAFERGNWPRNPDQAISGYAEELEIAPEELWLRALDLWREELALSEGGADDSPTPPGAVAREIEAAPPTDEDRPQTQTRRGPGRRSGIA